MQGYKNAEWDRLIEQAAYKADSNKRGELYRKLQRKAFDEAPQIYLSHPADLRVIRGELSGYRPNPISPGADFYPLSKTEAAAR